MNVRILRVFSKLTNYMEQGCEDGHFFVGQGTKQGIYWNQQMY